MALLGCCNSVGFSLTFSNHQLLAIDLFVLDFRIKLLVISQLNLQTLGLASFE